MFYFFKMQALGNDFIVINNLEKKIEYSYKLLCQYLCNRNFGVGADGVLILEKSEITNFKMRIFNQDGSEAEMCGNGIRCLAKYIYENKLINKNEFEIETLSGIRKVKIYLDEKAVKEIEVDMGKPKFNLDEIPVIYLENNYNGKINIDGIDVYPVSLGNPHIVCFFEKIEDLDVKNIGSKLEKYKYFPNRINVEFVEIIDKESIKVRVWERGVGETLGCGTGACAASVIFNKYKSTNSEIFVDLPGGKIKVICDNTIKLIGNAENIFEGKILI